MHEPIPKNVFFKFFEGKATPLESKLIEEWVSDSKNEELFYQYLDEWESHHPQYRPNYEQAFSIYLKSLNSLPTRLPSDSTNGRERVYAEPPRKNTWWYSAASLVLLLGLAVFLLRKPLFYQSYQTAFGQTKEVHLPDGTRVTLNANSVLWVPRIGFQGKKRQVLLQGEAEFKVAHTTDNQRFVVKTDTDFEVEVLGTQFILYARDRGKKVLLNQGKVKVNYLFNQQKYLQPGDLLELEASSGKSKVTRVEQPQRYSAWKQHQFYFDNTPLSEVAVLINEQFGVKVRITDPVTANRRIAGVFKAKNADELLEAISALMDLKMVKKSASIELSPTNPAQ